jgi:hypothetical protein
MEAETRPDPLRGAIRHRLARATQVASPAASPALAALPCRAPSRLAAGRAARPGGPGHA